MISAVLKDFGSVRLRLDTHCVLDKTAQILRLLAVVMQRNRMHLRANRLPDKWSMSNALANMRHNPDLRILKNAGEVYCA